MARSWGLPWTVKHRPKSINEVVGNSKAKAAYVDWLKKRLAGAERRAALLYGPPGVGKTALVEASANQFGLELIELDASDLQNTENVRRIAYSASLDRSLLGYRGKLIFFDEVDNINRGMARLIVNEIIAIIERSPYPVVLVANDAWVMFLRPLHRYCLLIEFKKLSLRDMMARLKRICSVEGLICTEEALRILSERNDGDLRAAILDLQHSASIAAGRRITPEVARAAVGLRDREYNVFRVLGRIFYANKVDVVMDAVNHSMIDLDTLFRWVEENIPRVYGSIGEIYRAYEALSRADIYLRRISIRQYWSLMKYYMLLMSAGVSVAKFRRPKGWRYSFPTYLRKAKEVKMARAARDAVLEKLSRRLHASKRKVLSEYMPFLMAMYVSSPKYAKAIKNWLGLRREEEEYLEKYSQSFRR